MDNKDKVSKNKQSGYKRHVVPCSNCGKDILDHMTQCPFCKAEITPKYYKPMDPSISKKIRFALAVIGFIIIIILLFFGE
ncbi:MAG: hypothetical protein GX283_03620 [Clostridiaceae bacterium]|jgi:uncharacterized membrane protein YvbJ|nr:hypothetical protein [Clostridiaceae bacterium]